MKFSFVLVAMCICMGTSQAQTAVDTQKNDALVTIGTMSACALYNTYLAIGSIADAFGMDAYTADQVKDLMGEQINMLPAVKEQMNTLVSSGFIDTPEDLAYCRKIAACVDLLVDEAWGLRDYAINGDAASQLKFADARTQAWALIADILQIQ